MPRAFSPIACLTLGITLCFASSAFAQPRFVPSPPPAAAFNPLGWSTQKQKLPNPTANSELGRQFPGSTLELTYYWDEFSIVFPLWSSRGSYVLVVPHPETRTFEQFHFDDFDQLQISRLAGLPLSALDPPSRVWFPYGWRILAGIAAFIGYAFLHQKYKRYAARRRIRNLLQDARYRAALALIGQRHAEFAAANPEPPLDAETEDDAVDDSSDDDEVSIPDSTETHATETFNAAIALLEQQGIPHDQALHNLPLILQALHEHPEDWQSNSATSE